MIVMSITKVLLIIFGFALAWGALCYLFNLGEIGAALGMLIGMPLGQLLAFKYLL